MEWTRDKTIQLIQEYRKRRGLWDMTSDDYRKKEMKQRLLNEVSANLGNISVIEIEKKFHTLRTQYHREIMRMKRKEPYNSKWFGFHNLTFLSSPKACRSSKNRLKSEITDEGIVRKYILRQSDEQDDEMGSEREEEYVTLQTRNSNSPNITFEAVNVQSSTSVANSRSRELEKLIEETTKDVDEVEEPKPKVHIKDSSRQHQQHYSATPMNTSLEDENQQHEEMDEQQHHIAIELQCGPDELAYNSSNSNNGNEEHSAATIQTHPTRIIKLHARENSCAEQEYYEDEPQPTPQQHHHQLQAITGGKRIYQIQNAPSSTPDPKYNVNGRFTSPPFASTAAAAAPAALPRGHDEFSTYGEYVADELRQIKSRKVLALLKNKINTAIFEANMSEFKK